MTNEPSPELDGRKPKVTPILFSAPMVRANLEGRKTVTRRLVKPSSVKPVRGSAMPRDFDSIAEFRPSDGGFDCYPDTYNVRLGIASHRFGSPGDLLMVRETVYWNGGGWCYRADTNAEMDKGIRWTPSIHMPKAACRLVLRRVGPVRVERVNQITEAECIAEGVREDNHRNGDTPTWSVPGTNVQGWECPMLCYAALWDSINGLGSFKSGPWVWVIPYEVAAKTHAEAQALLTAQESRK